MTLVQSKTRIGRAGRILILQDHNGHTAAAQGREIKYSRFYLFIDEVAVLYRNPKMNIYRQVDLDQLLTPLLANADQISPREVQSRLLRQKHPGLLIPLIIFSILLLAVIASRLYQ